MAEKKKIKIFKNKKQKNLIFMILIAVIIIIVGLVIALSGKDENEKEKDKDKESEKTVISNEETVEDEYGFSEEDAINAVKNVFNSDAYEYKAKVREDNMYVVTVTNPDSGSKYTYLVDPNDGTFQELIEE